MVSNPHDSMEWLSAEMAAARLGVATRTLSQLIDNGSISAYRVGCVARVKAVDVDRWLDTYRIRPGTITRLYSKAVSDEPDNQGDETQDDIQHANAPAPPEPWGSPPTPLLPCWYFEALAATPLPSCLVTLLVDSSDGAHPRIVSDLASFWEMRHQPLSTQARSMLFEFVLTSEHPRPPLRHVVVSASADITRLLLCPLGTRARNCIDRAFAIGIIAPGRAMTVAELLSLPRFGVASLLDVMCVSEAAVDSGFLNALRSQTTEGESSSSPMTELPNVQPASSPQRGLVVQRGAAVQGGAAVQWVSEERYGASEDLPPAWRAAMVPLGKLIAAAAEIHDARTLTDVLSCDLGGLMLNLGISDDCDRVMVSDLASSATPAEEALTALVEFCESLSPLHRLILRKRVLTAEPLSQAKIGSEVGFTGEAIRRQQKYLDGLLRELLDTSNAFGCWMSALVAVISSHIGPIVRASHLEKHISTAFPEKADAEAKDPFDGCSMASVARRLLRRELGYTCDDGVCINREVVIVAETLKDTARRLADDVGMIAKAELFSSIPEVWQQHADALLDWCDLHLIGNGRVALRDTARARVKAAMLAIGRPATKEEIAEACGFTPDRIRHQLSVIAGVVRADKTRWGFREWVDDVYEGIPAEILQRIEQDGGATRLDRLVDELPRKFGVSENSVRAYVATSKFSLVDGCVRVADPSCIALKPLSVVVHGHTDDGKPFWGFDVKARYFEGYSLAGLPPEVATVLGCEPDGRVRIPISYPSACRPISVSWQLSSTSGAVVGYLSDPLRRLGARSGDHAALIINSPESVSVRLSDSASPSSD